MILTFNDYRIRRYDSLNIVIEQKKAVNQDHHLAKGQVKDRWFILGYYPNLRRALMALVDHVASEDHHQVCEVLQAIEQLRAYVDDWVGAGIAENSVDTPRKQ